MDKIIISESYRAKERAKNHLQKDGIYMFIDCEFNTDTQEYEYMFVKSNWC